MKDGWLKAAMKDDNMVADLLIRLRQSSSSASSSSSKPPPPPAPVIPAWGVKQPRSTPFRKYSSAGPTRCSPRTPLSWSGGAATASPSDGGSDEASCGFASRSKNFSQLKEEETDLLNERVNLKRIRLDLNQQSADGGGVLSMEPEVRFTNYRSQMEKSTANVHQSTLPRQEVAETKKGGFVLPDLNMPVGEDEFATELW